ncbi:MAG: hypothetical protein QW100_01460 [Thermoplasmatales archaeon]
MLSEKALYSIIAAIVIIGGIGIGAAYYKEVSSPSTAKTTQPSTTLFLVISPNNWFNNSTIHHRQPAYFVVGPNGELESSALIKLPAHELITIVITDYDSGVTSNIGPNGTSNNSTYAKVIGTVGGVEYIYNGSSQYINATLSGNSSDNITISHGQGWAVSSLPWNATLGGWEVTHTFTILNDGSILLNIPTYAGSNPSGGAITVAHFYLNNTGTYTWQCFVPCGNELDGWGGAMATAGWMTGVVDVVS